MNRKIMRGEMYYADLIPVIGSEQGGVRPVLIVQNNMGNHYILIHHKLYHTKDTFAYNSPP